MLYNKTLVYFMEQEKLIECGLVAQKLLEMLNNTSYVDLANMMDELYNNLVFQIGENQLNSIKTESA